MRAVVEGVIAAPLWQQVADGVRRSIQTGRLRPGDRIVEMQLATQLGISRNPIREGLRQLQQQGILEYRANVGTVVAHLSKRDARFAIEVRAFLETQAVRAILEFAERPRLDALEEVVLKMKGFEGVDVFETSELLDEEFHRKLVEASGSKMLRCVWQALDPYTWMSIAFEEYDASFEPDPRGLYENHRRLLDAIKSGHTIESEDMIYEHIMATAARLVDK